jgi:hypothetical protein
VSIGGWVGYLRFRIRDFIAIFQAGTITINELRKTLAFIAPEKQAEASGNIPLHA